MKVSPLWISVVLGLSVRVAPAQLNSASTANRFQFRTPQQITYRVEENEAKLASAGGKDAWLEASAGGSGTNIVKFGSRVVVQLQSPDDLNRLTAGSSLELSRVVASNIFILQAPDALTAAREAHRMAALPEVLASYPVMRRQNALHGSYAPQPTDFNFSFRQPNLPYQWPLEHRNADGSSAGADLNVRAAWPYTTGRGVTIAIADTGIDMAHPELSSSVAGAPHYNFVLQNGDAGPVTWTGRAAHGTEVAGLAAADLNNARMVGVAPGAQLASWVIFDSNIELAADDQLMDMYQYYANYQSSSNSVAVQNHSWGNNGVTLSGPTLLEQIGISNAVTRGRGGLGVVMVRSCGNDRGAGANADDDGYPSDPHVIAVASVRFDNRVAGDSEPGACLLVGAPGEAYGEGFNGLFTTDLAGTNGVNNINYLPPNQDMNNYVYFSLGFYGTSASAPQIAGIAALILSANPSLSYRDVQQILIFSSRQFDFADPDLATNGAGFLVSHNVGFGVPDAGAAVNLARAWINRPAPTNITLTSSNVQAIPDDGLRLLATGNNLPANLSSIQTLPSFGPHADTPTPIVPLVDVGLATNSIAVSLTNKAALIQRGENTYASKITFAAQAGAAFAVIYNYSTNVDDSGGDQLTRMGGTDFVPIPAVFIGESDGQALKAFLQTNVSALAQIHLNSTSYVFAVTNTMLCEHVGLRVMTDHQLRGDVRITLVSPSGTRSVLQRINDDTNSGPADWTYYSTHHFFESSAGNWTAYFSDEGAGNTGSVQFVSLTINGVPITDADHDGLDDNWEVANFGNLGQAPRDDPDRDGYSNMREQIMGTNPKVADVPFKLDLSPWNPSRARLSWPGSPNFNYEVWGGTNVASLTLITNLPGHFPEAEWFTPFGSLPGQFFRVRAIPNP